MDKKGKPDGKSRTCLRTRVQHLLEMTEVNFAVIHLDELRAKNNSGLSRAP